MATCDICGNEYRNALLISVEGLAGRGVYESFECAIAGHAPRCARCGCAIIGHGVQDDVSIYCCANCARRDGNRELVDNAGVRS